MADGAVARRPDHAARSIYVLGALYVVRRAAPHRRPTAGSQRPRRSRPRHDPCSRRRRRRRHVHQGGRGRAARPVDRRQRGRADHAHGRRAASPPVSSQAVAELAEQVGAGQHRSRHPFDHAGRQRTDRGRRRRGRRDRHGPAARPLTGREAHPARATSSSPRASGSDVRHAFFDVTDGLPAAEVRAALDPVARAPASPRSASPRRSRPTILATNGPSPRSPPSSACRCARPRT